MASWPWPAYGEGHGKKSIVSATNLLIAKWIISSRRKGGIGLQHMKKLVSMQKLLVMSEFLDALKKRKGPGKCREKCK